ncbi:response regulator [Methanospirillum purgamenti]|uniref:Response regulator n=1 Tax=Methanospirillum hungatei TaxID=2203 RepID=A0A8F5VQE0_METHU|nr:response regulator [Methanospirillum hungatei]QXO96068.1 response regulator [Methanospirillum hungatei]
MPEVTLFIVEDNPVIADLISWRLSEMGYNVAGTAEDSIEALSRIEEILPTLVLMDINLPGEMDGIEVASEIIRKFNIPIVYISSIIDSAIMERAKKTKPRGYIVKPFTDNQLRATIEMALHP